MILVTKFRQRIWVRLPEYVRRLWPARIRNFVGRSAERDIASAGIGGQIPTIKSKVPGALIVSPAALAHTVLETTPTFLSINVGSFRHNDIPHYTLCHYAFF